MEKSIKGRRIEIIDTGLYRDAKETWKGIEGWIGILPIGFHIIIHAHMYISNYPRVGRRAGNGGK